MYPRPVEPALRLGLQPVLAFGVHDKASRQGSGMRTNAECISKARELSEFAEAISDPVARAYALALALSWLHLSPCAEWQDEFTLTRATGVH
jgi:hypothetical protein